MAREDFVNKDFIQCNVAERVAVVVNEEFSEDKLKLTKDDVLRIKHLQSRVIKVAIEHGYEFDLRGMGKFFLRKLSRAEQRKGFTGNTSQVKMSDDLTIAK